MDGWDTPSSWLLETLSSVRVDAACMERRGLRSQTTRQRHTIQQVGHALPTAMSTRAKKNTCKPSQHNRLLNGKKKKQRKWKIRKTINQKCPVLMPLHDSHKLRDRDVQKNTARRLDHTKMKTNRSAHTARRKILSVPRCLIHMCTLKYNRVD